MATYVHNGMQRYPLQFSCNLANAVMDDKTGGLLKYCHLINNPRYKDVWTKSFGTRIHCLVTRMETIFFIKYDKISQEHQGDKIYAQIVCVYHDGKKDKYHTHITMGGNLVNYP
jgi:hypothetical protein